MQIKKLKIKGGSCFALENLQWKLLTLSFALKK
jgi:hypothetical protein